MKHDEDHAEREAVREPSARTIPEAAKSVLGVHGSHSPLPQPSDVGFSALRIVLCGDRSCVAARRAGTLLTIAIHNGGMPSWRPESASSPDAENERYFAPLHDREAGLAEKLLERYGRRWLDLAGLPHHRLPEVPDTVELMVAPDWTEPPNSGLLTLRLRSWYTASTYWLYPWDGTDGAALTWIDQVAELQAGNVEDNRRHGPTVWDE